ncbi:tripartite tricarboxylate transporter permease [Pelagibacterium sp.]|uniref:tripartite tricarboxylate transporter permease n=1 Tax=Pelagibacterium sp. TaxID=1967288 RepID=UPI003A919133
MDIFANLQLGLQTAVTIENLGFALVGCLLGTLIGVLPGMGPLVTISMLLPFTFGMDPISALIMLAGIYYGGAYGGSTTAILVNVPGETSSVVTVIDGHKMAQQGRAGVAICTAAIGSFFAGCVGTLLLAAFATPLTRLALEFGAAEYFSLMLLGLVGAVSLTSGSTLSAIGMILVGIMLGLVGTDVQTGIQRFVFDQPQLWDGIDVVTLAVGIFAFGHAVSGLRLTQDAAVTRPDVGSVFPTRQDIKRMVPPILRGTMVGSALGILPGAGQAIASFISYSLERKVSRYRHEMGHGAIEGVAAPESANNAAAQTAFIPTLTLGIPGSGTMALLLGAMVMHNIQPGPRVMVSNPDLFWGLIVSMWIGNLFLLILNIPLVGLWVQLLRIPYRFLFFAIIMFSCFGIFATNFSPFSIYLAAGIGLVGYVLKQFECEPAPLLLGFILGPMMEENFRRTLILSEGEYSVFVTQPISLVFLVGSVGLLMMALFPKIRQKRDEVAIEDA